MQKRSRVWRGIGLGLVVLLVGGAFVSALGAGREGSKSDPASSADGTTVADSESGGGGTARSGAAFSTGAADAPKSAPPISTALGAPSDAANASKSTATSSGVGSAVALGGLAAPGLPTRVVKTAEITVEVKRGKLADTVSRVTELVGGPGMNGFVAGSQQGNGRGVLTLRVPANEFERVMTQLASVGRVKSKSLRGDDVTAQYTDLEGRLRNARAQEAVLLDLMRQARTVQDSITVQQSLSQVQQQIEELEGQRRLLDDQSSFGTITATFAVPGAVAAEAAGDSTLAEAWDQAAGVSLNVIGGTLVLLGALLPIAVLALLGLAGWMVVRRHRSTAPSLAP